MLRTGALFAVLGAILWAGCTLPPPIVTRARVQLRSPSDMRCEQSLARFVIQALGDFPPAEQNLADLRPGGAALSLDRFPWQTEAFTLRGFSDADEIAGGAIALQSSDVNADALVLPYGRRCGVDDPGISPGASVAAMSDGGLLIAGGEGDPTPRDARYLGAGHDFFNLTQQLYTGRIGATVTAITKGHVAVIAGGGRSADGDVQDNYELYDVTTHAAERVGRPLCSDGRRYHGAVELPDGNVLLVGGLGLADMPRTDAEVLNPDTGCVTMVEGLSPPRVSPTVLALDDGAVLVLGGRNPNQVDHLGHARYVHEPRAFNGGELERTVVDQFPEMGYEDCALVALPGARVAQVGGLSVPSTGAPLPTSHVAVLLPDESIADLGPLAYVNGDALGATQLPLEHIHAVALPDGTIYATGNAGGRLRAIIIDVGRASTREVEARPPECTSDRECGAGKGCLERRCVDSECTNDRACDAGESCLRRRCVVACMTEMDCASGEACLSGRCLPPCTNDASCGAGLYCSSGECASEPPQVAVLTDGSVVELDESGACANDMRPCIRLRRDVLLTSLDNPSTTLLQVALDAWPRWEVGVGFLRARRDAARIDLPTMRFRRFRAELDADSGVRLLIQREGDRAEGVPIFDNSVGIVGCSVPRVDGAPLRVERDEDSLTISAGGETRVCRVNPLGDRVGLAASAEVGSFIRSVRVTRLPD